MKQYYFNVTNEERENILDKHKTTYDGYVTEYGNGNNMTPLNVVDMAGDKQGVTVNNKGEVSGYKNFGINESINEMRFDDRDPGLFSDEESKYKLDRKAKTSAKKDIKKHYYKNPFGDETGTSDKWLKYSLPDDTDFNFENLDEQEDDMYDYDEIEKSDRLKVGPPLDMIADREDDVKHGTVDFDGDIENYDLGDIIPFDAFNDDDDDDDDDFDFDFDPEDLMDDDDMFTLEPGDDSNEFSIDLTQDDDESNDDEITLDLTNDFDEEDTQPIMEQVNKSLDMFKRFKKYY